MSVWAMISIAVSSLSRRAAQGLRMTVLAVVMLALGGQAMAQAAGGQQADPRDPWEHWNRKVFSFNESLDQHILKPTAEAYTQVVPSMVRTGVNNFFGNVSDIWSAFNLMLQGRVRLGALQSMRVVFNSTFGVFGLADVSTKMGLERNSEDLGKTLGRWGFSAGPYVVWPLLGPSSVRDTAALPLDFSVSPSLFVSTWPEKTAVYGLGLVDYRSGLLQAGNMLEDIALDKYTFIRDAYLQRRNIYRDDDDFEVIDPVSDGAGKDKPAEADMPANTSDQANQADQPAQPAATPPEH